MIFNDLQETVNKKRNHTSALFALGFVSSPKGATSMMDANVYFKGLLGSEKKIPRPRTPTPSRENSSGLRYTVRGLPSGCRLYELEFPETSAPITRRKRSASGSNPFGAA
jgi:hypothetical protein